MNNPDVKIVIVHYGETDLLFKCLKSLGKITSYRNVVVSNNNLESLNPFIKQNFTGVHVVDNSANLGYAGGINSGIRYALNLSPQYILIITEDTTYEKNFLTEITQYAAKHRVDIVGPIIKNEKKKIWFDGGEIDRLRYTAGHSSGHLDFIPGCCKLVRKEVFEEIGILDERYFIYYEDVDFDLRARKANFSVGIAPKAIVYHDTYHTNQAYKNMDYYLARNHFLFLWKLAPLSVKTRELIRLPKTSMNILPATNSMHLVDYLIFLEEDLGNEDN